MYEDTPTPQLTPDCPLKEDNQHGAWPTPFPDSLTSRWTVKSHMFLSLPKVSETLCPVLISGHFRG